MQFTNITDVTIVGILGIILGGLYIHLKYTAARNIKALLREIANNNIISKEKDERIISILNDNTKTNTDYLKIQDSLEELETSLVDLSYYTVLEATDDEHYSKVLNYFIEKIMEDNTIIPKGSSDNLDHNKPNDSDYKAVKPKKGKLLKDVS